VPEREVLGTGARRVQDLAARRALVETGNHNRQLWTPGFDPTHERTDGGTTPATQPDHDERGALIAKPLNELVAVGMELQPKRRVAAADGQRPTQSVFTPPGYDYSGKHRYLHR